MCLQLKSFDTTVGKGEIARIERFLFFFFFSIVGYFLPILRTLSHFHQI